MDIKKLIFVMMTIDEVMYNFISCYMEGAIIENLGRDLYIWNLKTTEIRYCGIPFEGINTWGLRTNILKFLFNTEYGDDYLNKNYIDLILKQWCENEIKKCHDKKRLY